MSLPRVTKCCFCFSLKTGSLILGYVTLINCLSMIALSVTSIIWASQYVKSHDQTSTSGPNPGFVHTPAYLYTIEGFNLLEQLFYLTITVLLLVGVHQNKPHLMRYYYYAGIISLILALIVIATAFIFSGFIITVLLLTFCAFRFYCLLVIRSTFLDIEDKKSPPPYELHTLRDQQAPLYV